MVDDSQVCGIVPILTHNYSINCPALDNLEVSNPISTYNSKLTTLALPSVIFEPKFKGSVRNLVYSDLPGQPPRRQELRHSRDLKVSLEF
ncbi:unnamed protein product [Euphydryas editha]|uniref:Uncharacterized protein n=1 Tax=Euphydryas editha TaxID=104508 RepID=A0AAU9U321_EUPED|nr:unnamed protein product [Euphydryas editha]